MLRFLIPFILLILCNNQLQAQNLEEVDQKVTTYKESNIQSVEDLAKRINADFNTEMHKARAIYSWIAQNISYDYAQYRRPNNFYFSRGSSRKERKIEWSTRHIAAAKKTFENEKGICDGYACLFQRLSELCGLESVMIEGYTKMDIRDIAKRSPETNHAWNAVKIENEWRFIDATWGAGYLEGRTFYPKFNATYFNTPAERFGLDHHDASKRIISKITRRKFFRQPLYYSTYIGLDLEIISPTTGIVKMKSDKGVELRIHSDQKPSQVTYSFSRDQYASELRFRKKGKYYEAIIPKPKRKSKTLTLYYENEGLVSYKLKY